MKIAIGTAQFGMSYGIANQNRQIHEDEITEILDLAWEIGINTLDTAKAYGNSEEVIGKYLIQQPGNRWNIITKLSENGMSVYDQIKDSTEKLTIYPDVIMAHSAELYLDEEFQSELAVMKEDKLFKKAGVSLYSEDEIYQILESTFKPDVIQLPMNILDTRLYRKGILERLNKKGVEIHVRSVFLQGLFYLPKSVLNNRFSDAVPSLEKLKSIATKAGLTIAELSLLWLLHLDEINKVIIGVDDVSQLMVHFKTLDKNVDPSIFEEALSIYYNNEKILNPSLW